MQKAAALSCCTEAGPVTLQPHVAPKKPFIEAKSSGLSKAAWSAKQCFITGRPGLCFTECLLEYCCHSQLLYLCASVWPEQLRQMGNSCGTVHSWALSEQRVSIFISWHILLSCVLQHRESPATTANHRSSRPVICHTFSPEIRLDKPWANDSWSTRRCWCWCWFVPECVQCQSWSVSKSSLNQALKGSFVLLAVLVVS